jgi:hypothetical protein
MKLRLFVGAVALLVILVVVVVVYLNVRFARQADKRDEALWQLLQPAGERLLNGEAVDAAEVHRLAQRPATRSVLLALLRNTGHAELFPPELLTRRAEAECTMAAWLMLPNEMQSEPSELSLMEIVERPFRGQLSEIYVFKFKMPANHWAGSEWQMGVVGPFVADEAPFAGRFGAFSRSSDDRPGVTEPGALVDWYLQMVDRKFPAAPATES